jgi:hypothetical protein
MARRRRSDSGGKRGGAGISEKRESVNEDEVRSGDSTRLGRPRRLLLASGGTPSTAKPPKSVGGGSRGAAPPQLAALLIAPRRGAGGMMSRGSPAPLRGAGDLWAGCSGVPRSRRPPTTYPGRVAAEGGQWESRKERRGRARLGGVGACVAGALVLGGSWWHCPRGVASGGPAGHAAIRLSPLGRSVVASGFSHSARASATMDVVLGAGDERLADRVGPRGQESKEHAFEWLKPLATTERPGGESRSSLERSVCRRGVPG